MPLHNWKETILPPTYLFAAMLVMVMLHFVLPLIKCVHYPWNLLGLAPLASGIYLNLSADVAFKRAGTTVKPFAKATTLITSGVFRISRHPMYLGMVLILAGITLLLGTLTPLFVLLLFALFMEFVFVRAEEKMLYEQFGESWLAYQANVRKWI